MRSTAATGNYNGAILTLARNGGANADDVFGTAGTLSFSGSNVLVGATTVGTFTNANGQLQITFNANATSALVDSVLQQITYANSSEDPPLSVQINYALNDGNTGSQGGGPTPGIGSGSITVNITAVNDRPEIASVETNASYTIGSTGTLLSPALSVIDVDSNQQGGLAPDAIVNAVVKIEDFVLGDQLFVNLPTSGGFFVVDDGGGPVVTNISVQSNSLGQLVVSGADTPAHYALVLDAVNYRSTNPDPRVGGTRRQPHDHLAGERRDGGDSRSSARPRAPDRRRPAIGRDGGRQRGRRARSRHGEQRRHHLGAARQHDHAGYFRRGDGLCGRSGPGGRGDCGLRSQRHARRGGRERPRASRSCSAAARERSLRRPPFRRRHQPAGAGGRGLR